LGLVDVIVAEPLGGAHRDVETTMQSLRRALKTELDVLQKRTTEKLLAARYERLMSYGKFKETAGK
jgi:acetyl-CoA carboxylase carboxyl transferase subunit alpha